MAWQDLHSELSEMFSGYASALSRADMQPEGAVPVRRGANIRLRTVTVRHGRDTGERYLDPEQRAAKRREQWRAKAKRIDYAARRAARLAANPNLREEENAKRRKGGPRIFLTEEQRAAKRQGQKKRTAQGIEARRQKDRERKLAHPEYRAKLEARKEQRAERARQKKAERDELKRAQLAERARLRAEAKTSRPPKKHQTDAEHKRTPEGRERRRLHKMEYNRNRRARLKCR